MRDLIRTMEEIALAHGPEAMLDALIRRLGEGLGAAHCACLIISADRRRARLIAVHENPLLRDVAVDLFRYPEAIEAAVTGCTVYAQEVLRDRLFLTHLAQWPDSPEVHEIESVAAVPLITDHDTRAVVVIRTRRGDPALLPGQVTIVEQLVRATARLLEREAGHAAGVRQRASAPNSDRLICCADLQALDRRLHEELERVRRYGSQLSFALLGAAAPGELDDRFGAGSGERFLAQLGISLLQEIRAPDFAARFAADEFALLLPSTSRETARLVLGRIAARFATQLFQDLEPRQRPRLAAGLVGFPQRGLSRVEDLLAAAEAALMRDRTRVVDGLGILGSVAA